MRGERAAPDLGAATTARMLASDPMIRATLLGLDAHSTLSIRAESIEQMLRQPVTYAYELGALLTAAWGAASVRDTSRELTADRRITAQPMRPTQFIEKKAA